mmetsp:Transcript_44668/g.87863  ORF Transcript_44668/g.87863 Transcript_44668/m.87863 type:complete len:82 (+) Transcript_44668:585-830(+)
MKILLSKEANVRVPVFCNLSFGDDIDKGEEKKRKKLLKYGQCDYPCCGVDNDNDGGPPIEIVCLALAPCPPDLRPCLGLAG